MCDVVHVVRQPRWPLVLPNLRMLPAWFRPRATVRGDLAFIRRWALALVPAWGLVGLAAWVLPVSTYHATTTELRFGLVVAIVFSCALPDNYARLRRAGMVYLVSFLIYTLMHILRGWTLGH